MAAPLVLAAATLAISLALTAIGPSAEAAPTATLEQQVGQLVVLSFSGTTVPEYVRRALRANRAAGVILFRGNVESPAQLRRLTRTLRQAGGRPIVAVDQEGGTVRRVPWVGPVLSAPAQERRGSVRADAAAAARSLKALGITVNLAPVADVPRSPTAALFARAFSTDASAAASATAASVLGWRTGGVATAVKHFPGIGAAPASTDDAIVTIRTSRAELARVDLAPFRSAIAAGVPLVMVGHARYPALDGERIASQSRAVISGLLREGLGFRGVVVTDSMEASASLATGSITAVSERAVRAGADLVLLTGRGSYAPVYRHLLAVARRDAPFRARVSRSAARVTALRARGAAAPPG